MRSLQSVLLNSGSFNSETAKMENINPQAFFEMQDKAAELLVKEVISPDGSSGSFSKDWLYNLPFEDGNMIYEFTTAIFNKSNLGQEERKN